MTDYVFELQGVTFYYKTLRPLPIFDILAGKKYRSAPSKFKALDNLNFKIEKGRKVGIIGKNGSGKTTLIRVLGGIYGPDQGRLIVNSKSISMLALGVGFDTSATGYDNIYLNSLLRGYQKKDVDAKVEDIIEFSGIRDSIYNPVKTYSTGMRMRLAFSIAVQFEPDVLLIDEALAVGDSQFQKKSGDKMNEMIRDSQRTVIVVSHSIPFIKNECDMVVWLDSGRVRMMGTPDEVLAEYSAAK
jgi:ABC-type polysaccharide/polyol phosphate transport system ATPase subunit